MQIALIIAILTAFILQGLIILLTLKLSLKWQIQVKNGIVPTIDNPIKQVIDEHQLKQAQKLYKNTFDEYLNGVTDDLKD